MRVGRPGDTSDGQTGQDGPGYFAIPVSSLRLDTITGFNLFLRSPRDNQHVLFRNGELKFTGECRAKLEQNKISSVYIAAADRAAYMRYLENNLSCILSDDTVPPREKSKVLYGSASQLLHDVFTNPAAGENIKRAQDMVENTVGHLMRGAEHFGSLLSIMSFDYQTYTHSVNVSVFGVALARRIGLSRGELIDLGTGLLLHDVGKSAIDPAVLFKEGPLTPEEWAMVKTHPDRGVHLLRESGRVSDLALTVVHQHHEKCSGKGYPQGLEEPDIHLYAKIASLADVFDALTTKRCYKQAVQSFPAIRIMQNEMAESFNEQLLRELILLMNAPQIFGERSDQRAAA